MVSQSHTVDRSYLSWEKSWRDRLSWEADIRAEGWTAGREVGKTEGRRELLEEQVANGIISRSTYEAALLMQKEVIPPKRYCYGSRSSLL